MKQNQRTTPKYQNNLACWLFFPFGKKEKEKEKEKESKFQPKSLPLSLFSTRKSKSSRLMDPRKRPR